MEDDGGVGNITVSNSSINNAIKSLTDIKKVLSDDHKTNCLMIDKMCTNWRSQVGMSASAFFYAGITLAMYSQYCINTIDRAKCTMRDFSDDMDIIDQNLEAMNFLVPSGSTAAHSEMRALDEALKAREAVGLPVNEGILENMYLYNIDLRASRKIQELLAKCRCPNCTFLTDGINTLIHD